MGDVSGQAGGPQDSGVGAAGQSLERLRIPVRDRLDDQRRVRARAGQGGAQPSREVAVLERGRTIGARADDLQVELATVDGL